jgi:hypothetical protein
MAMNVINQLINVIVELSAIAKICKYKGLHDKHQFILMAMEVHKAPKHGIDAPRSSLMDSITNPKVKTTKGEGVRERFWLAALRG